MSGADCLLGTFHVEHQMTGGALEAVGEERTHRLLAVRTRLILGQFRHAGQFVNLGQARPGRGRRGLAAVMGATVPRHRRYVVAHIRVPAGQKQSTGLFPQAVATTSQGSVNAEAPITLSAFSSIHFNLKRKKETCYNPD